MKKIIALVLAAVMVFAMASTVMAGEAPEGYTQCEVFDGTYGFGDAEITAFTNDDFTAFYLTWEAFDEEQILEGTVDDGIVDVSYDETGFMTGDAQLIWDDAVAAGTWGPIGAAPAEEAAVEAAPAEEVVIDYAFDRSWPEEELKLAMAVYDTTDEQFLAMREYNDYLEQNFNIKFKIGRAHV